MSKPVIGIDTLAAIAANVQGVSSPVLVVADARRDEVYAALFAADGACLKSPAVMSIAMAGRDVPPGTQVIGTATDAVIAASGRTDLTRSKARDLPDAASFARLAARMEPGPMPSPLYLRSPDAKPQMGLRLRSLPIEIRDIADPHIFAQIHGECFDNPWDAKAIADLLAMPGALALTACEGEEPVAFVLARRAADEAEIITIATRPFAQRRGIAARLVADAATRLSQQNVKSLFLEVASANAAARALYGQAGFAERGQRPAYYANGDDAIIMRKDLA